MSSSPYKHADGSSCWTKECRIGNTSTVKEQMKQEWFSSKAPQDSKIVRKKTKTPEETIQELTEKVVYPNGLDYDAITRELGWIQEWEKPWTEAEKNNLAIVEKIAELTEQESFEEKDEKVVNALMLTMEPAVVPQRRYGFSSNDDSWRARDKMLHDLAGNLLTRKVVQKVELKPVDIHAENDRILELETAQNIALSELNHGQHLQSGTTELGNVEQYYQDAITRVARGDEAIDPEGREINSSLLTEPQRIFSKLHPDSALRNSQLYLAAVFPVNELKKEMQRTGLDNVSVSSFQNSREWGNVYTVVTPDGSTRSFSVYEHRNTDSIIINGKSNWDREELPYTADSKNRFFAEFAPDDKTRAAQALTFYLMQAQQGTLNEDDELDRNATRRDWNAILDSSLPGFKQWRQAKITDTYIAPQDETEEDTLRRLDF